MRLWIAVPISALAGALVAGAVLLVLPTSNASPGAREVPTSSPGAFASGSTDGGQVDEPALPSLPVGAVSVGYGASGTGVAGVPVGFAQSPDGAAAAATAWLAVVEGAGVLDTQRRAVVLNAIGDPGFAATATARLADRAAALGVDASGRPAAGYVMATVWAVRGAYRIVSFDAAAATVEIWHSYQLGVVAAGAQPTPGQWRRATAAMRWDDGARDWRMRSDFSLVDGPDPQVAAPSRLERAAALAGLGSGWLVYANTQD